MYKKNLQADVSCEIKNIIEADDIETQTLWQAVFLFPIYWSAVIVTKTMDMCHL